MLGARLDSALDLEHFAVERSGTVAVIFALMIVPILALIGAGLDYGRASSLKGSMQGAIDSAVVAGAHALARTGKAGDAQKAAENYFAASEAALKGAKMKVAINKDKGTVKGQVVASVPTSFLALVGVNKINVEVDAGAAAPRLGKSGGGASAAAASMPKVDREKFNEIVAKVTEFCEKLSQLGIKADVEACQLVSEGGFEKALRRQLANSGGGSGEGGGLIPAGVRLTN